MLAWEAGGGGGGGLNIMPMPGVACRHCHCCCIMALMLGGGGGWLKAMLDGTAGLKVFWKLGAAPWGPTLLAWLLGGGTPMGGWGLLRLALLAAWLPEGGMAVGGGRGPTFILAEALPTFIMPAYGP